MKHKLNTDVQPFRNKTHHPLLLPPKMKSMRDQSDVSLGPPNPVYVAKLAETFRCGVSARKSNMRKSGIWSCVTLYFLANSKLIGRGGDAPVVILYPPESDPVGGLLVVIQLYFTKTIEDEMK
jgi:hypothetical protein